MKISKWIASASLVASLNGLAVSAVADTGFIIMGDSGTGKEPQYRVAASMLQTCNSKQCDFVLGLGDNIYEYGPWSSTDSQFEKKFEKPFADFDIPFFMVEGNHDNSLIIPGDGGFNQRGFHEVNYSQHSPRWRMPSRFYSFETPDQSSLFIAFDSNPPNAYLPPIFSPYWWPNGRYVREQKAWIQQTVAESNNVWKFAFGHHPYMTNGHHGKDPLIQGKKPYRTFVQDALCGQVDFIFTGHEHAQEVLDVHEDLCSNTIQVVSGAAAKNSGKKTNHVYQEVWDSYDGKWGYMHGLVSGSQFTLTAYVVDEAGDTTEAFQKTYSK